MALARLTWVLLAAAVIALAQWGVPRLAGGIEPSLVDVAVGVAFAAVAVVVADARRLVPTVSLGAAAVLWTASGLAPLLPSVAGELAARVSLLPHALLVIVVALVPEGRLLGVRERLLAGAALAVGVAAGVGLLRPALLLLGLVALAAAARRWRGAASVIEVVTGVALSAIDLGALAGWLQPTFAATLLAVLMLAVLASLATLLDRDRQLWQVVAITDDQTADGDIFGSRLARALGVPTLRVGFLLDGTLIDFAGRPVELPAGGTRVESAVLHPAIPQDPFLWPTLVGVLGRVGEVARLRHAQRARAEDLAQSRRLLLRAADDERVALERRLEDTVAARIDEIQAELNSLDGLEALRERARTTREELSQLGDGVGGPPDAVELVNGLGRLAALAGTRVRLHVEPALDLPPAALRVAWFTCVEGLVNVAKHAHASQVDITISAAPGDRVLIRIADDGPGGAIPTGSGLQGLADRAADFGAVLDVSSSANGTVLTLDLPRYGLSAGESRVSHDVPHPAPFLA